MASDKLNDFERGTILPLVVGLIREAHGRPITSFMIAEAIRKQGYPSCNPLMVRKVINYIRVHDVITCLAACGNGYFVASNERDISDTIYSLEGRVEAIQEVIEALKEQRYIKYNI